MMPYQPTHQKLDQDDLDAPIVMGGPTLSPEQVRKLNAAMQQQKQEAAQRPKPRSGNWQTEPADRLNLGPGRQARIRLLFFETELHKVNVHYQWNVVSALCQKHLNLECPYCGQYYDERTGLEAIRVEWPVVMFCFDITEIATGIVQPVNKLVITSYAKNSCSPWSGFFSNMVQRLMLEHAPMHTYDQIVTQTGKGTDARFDVYPAAIDPQPFRLPPPWKMPSYREMLISIDNRFKRLASYRTNPAPQQNARPVERRTFNQGGNEYIEEREAGQDVYYSTTEVLNAPDDEVDIGQIFKDEPPQSPPVQRRDPPQAPRRGGAPRAEGSPPQWVPN